MKELEKNPRIHIEEKMILHSQSDSKLKAMLAVSQCMIAVILKSQNQRGRCIDQRNTITDPETNLPSTFYNLGAFLKQSTT